MISLLSSGDLIKICEPRDVHHLAHHHLIEQLAHRQTSETLPNDHVALCVPRRDQVTLRVETHRRRVKFVLLEVVALR